MSKKGFYSATSEPYDEKKADKALQISSPLSWVALLGLTFVVAVIIVWAFTAYIPETITAVGAITPKYQTNTLFADGLGRLQQYTVQPGDHIAQNQVVCYIWTETGEIIPVKSTQAGVVARTLVAEGDYIGDSSNDNRSFGKAIIKIDPDPLIASSQVVVFYVPKETVGQLSVGMEAHISLTATKNQTYGHMIGRITNIDRYATTSEDLMRLHGSELGLQITNEPVAVTCELALCDPRQPTTSGYWWSNQKGSLQATHNGDKCSVKVIVKNIHPIEKFIANLSDMWHGK